jgi:hypothetical protein
MQNPTEKEITNRAYQLWEQAGKPEGRDKEFYHQAEHENHDAKLMRIAVLEPLDGG